MTLEYEAAAVIGLHANTYTPFRACLHPERDSVELSIEVHSWREYEMLMEFLGYDASPSAHEHAKREWELYRRERGLK